MKRIAEINAVFDDGSAVMRLQCSAVDDLPELGGTVETFKAAAGTTAHIIQAGKKGTLDDNGKWYDEDGNEITDEPEPEPDPDPDPENDQR